MLTEAITPLFGRAYTNYISLWAYYRREIYRLPFVGVGTSRNPRRVAAPAYLATATLVGMSPSLGNRGR